MVHELYNWVLAWAAHPQAPMALFLLSVAESSFFPLPPDILLMAMCLAEPEHALLFASITSIGSILGGAFGFGIGRWGGRPIVKKILSEERRQGVEALYNKYDYWAIGIAGFTPIPYKIFTITAGAFAIKFRNFLLASIVSRPARFFLVGLAFQLWGPEIKEIIERYFNVASILFIVLLVGGFWLVKWFGNKSVDNLRAQ